MGRASRGEEVTVVGDSLVQRRRRSLDFYAEGGPGFYEDGDPGGAGIAAGCGSPGALEKLSSIANSCTLSFLPLTFVMEWRQRAAT